jgi:hypothetical protein
MFSYVCLQLHLYGCHASRIKLPSGLYLFTLPPTLTILWQVLSRRSLLLCALSTLSPSFLRSLAEVGCGAKASVFAPHLTGNHPPAIALNIVFGGKLGNITASQLLAIPEGQLKANVRRSCTR